MLKRPICNAALQFLCDALTGVWCVKLLALGNMTSLRIKLQCANGARINRSLLYMTLHDDFLEFQTICFRAESGSLQRSRVEMVRG